MDLNADLGEGFGAWRLGDDEALLERGHLAPTSPAASTPATRRPCAGSARRRPTRGVAVGAQVGYRDLAGFGRRRIEYDLRRAARRRASTRSAALDGFCRVAGTRVRYVKPHGALYNTAAVDEAQAAAVVAAVVDYDRTLPVLCLPGSVLAQLAAGAGLRAVGEGFADRGYRPTARWCRARQPGALVTDAGRGGRAGGADGRRPARSMARRRRRSCRCRSSRSACTATRPARSTWPAGSARPCATAAAPFADSARPCALRVRAREAPSAVRRPGRAGSAGGGRRRRR